MKKFLIGTLVLLTFFGASALWSQKGRARLELLEDREASNVELRRRIRSLQELVMDLDDRVARLEAKVGLPAGTVGAVSTLESANVTCFIETPFDGIFDATAPNETKARVEAVKSCNSKVKSRIHCSAEKVKCGR